MKRENILEFLKKLPTFVEERRTILFLIDGLGSNKINLPAFKRRICQTTFPSSTPTFLYSFHSLLPPAEHGFLEWYMRFKDKVITIPPWRTLEGRELRLGKDVKRKDVFPFKSLSEILSKRGFSITYYTPYAQSIFTITSGKGAIIKKIDFLSQVFPLDDSDFVCIYWPSIDTLLHKRYKDISFKVETKMLEVFIKILKRKIPKGSLLFILSDHGLTLIKRRYVLPEIDEIFPVGGARVAFYKDVEKGIVKGELEKRKIPAYVFEFDELEYFKGRRNKRCYKNFGKVVVIAKNNVGFKYPFKIEMKKEKWDLASHGGISREEKFINIWSLEK